MNFENNLNRRWGGSTLEIKTHHFTYQGSDVSLQILSASSGNCLLIKLDIITLKISMSTSVFFQINNI